MTERDRNQIISQCTRFVPGNYRLSPQEMFTSLADFTPPDVMADIYGEGEVIADFESELATLHVPDQ